MAVNIVEQIDDSIKIRYVICSVSDKSGLEEFIPGLIAVVPSVMVYSTGGTYDKIQEILGDSAEKHLIPVSSYTGQPEMQGGLVKTLDFKIYLGLLSESYNEAHTRDLERTGAVPIDMVVVNLYPFRTTIERPGTTLEEARANIDIGGPCMIRASAKNFLRIAAVTDPNDYKTVLEKLKNTEGRLSLETRFQLAQKAFAHTAEYDKTISGYLDQTDFDEARGGYHQLAD